MTECRVRQSKIQNVKSKMMSFLQDFNLKIPDELQDIELPVDFAF